MAEKQVASDDLSENSNASEENRSLCLEDSVFQWSRCGEYFLVALRRISAQDISVQIGSWKRMNDLPDRLYKSRKTRFQKGLNSVLQKINFTSDFYGEDNEKLQLFRRDIDQIDFSATENSFLLLPF